MHSGILRLSQCSHTGSKGLTPRMLGDVMGKYCLAKISWNQCHQIHFLKKVFSPSSVVDVSLFLFGSIEEDHEQVHLLILIRLNGMELFI